MSESHTPNSISQEPVNILFSPSSVVKKDVWEIDLIQILDLLIKILGNFYFLVAADIDMKNIGE